MRAPRRTYPVFFDPKGRRAKVANFILAGCAAVTVFVAAVVLYGVHYGPTGAPLSIRAQIEPPHALSLALLSQPENQIPLSFAQGRAIPPGAETAFRVAFLSTGSTPGAMLSFKRHAAEIDAVIPDWLRLRDTDGGVDIKEGPGRADLAGWIRGNASRILIYPEITNALSAAKTVAFFSDQAMQDRVAVRIKEYTADNDFGGVVLNLGDISESQIGRLAAFVDKLQQF